MGRSAEGSPAGPEPILWPYPELTSWANIGRPCRGGCMVARAAFHPEWLLRQRELRSTGRVKDPSPH
jgi:hypothetical protein